MAFWMKVNPEKSFQIVYPIFEVKDLTYLIESYVVQVNESGRLTLLNQNISSKNFDEFAHQLDETDRELIRLTDIIQPDSLNKQFNTKNLKKESPLAFLDRLSRAQTTETASALKPGARVEKVTADGLVREQVLSFLSRQKAKILPLLKGKLVFEQNRDGNPVGKPIKTSDEPIRLKYVFDYQPGQLRFQPVMTYKENQLELYKKQLIVLNEEPGWVIIEDTLYELPDGMKARKVSRFAQIEYQQVTGPQIDKMFEGFVLNTIKEHVVETRGFKVDEAAPSPEVIISLKEVVIAKASLQLFEVNQQDGGSGTTLQDDSRIQLSIKFRYGDHDFELDPVGHHVAPYHVVQIPRKGYSDYKRYKRNLVQEGELLQVLRDNGLQFVHGKATFQKGEAADILEKITKLGTHLPIHIQQNNAQGKKYFIGTSSIDLSIKEQQDWFELKAKIRFGPYEIPFYKLRRYILAGKEEFTLPNGEIAIIPAEWFVQYIEVFTHAAGEEEEEHFQLGKHFITLVQELKAGNLAQVSISQRLQKLRNFTEIESYPISRLFKGSLRPYQQAGYDWMMFLNSYNLGGCLADDMGLGKTVQTLALLAKQKEDHPGRTSLLVMPTSLVYNWQKEAERFVPTLRVLNHTGTNRNKSLLATSGYDIILTSYGTLRSDIEFFQSQYFHYAILDESQAIKNPTSQISKVVLQLRCAHKLILTGTPIENSTLDLWSQMNFVNPGLLGGQSFFKKQYLQPIEKKGDVQPLHKLHALIKPFILRRNKSQVATELPEKVENLLYCGMSEDQEALYNKAKAYYRNEIMGQIESQGLGKSRMLMLRGLTHLRQLANHPGLVDQTYEGSSGKMDDVFYKIEDVVSENHKILVFSQFVKHLTLLRKRLDHAGIAYAYLDGSTKDRASVVNEFQHPEGPCVFLISLKAGGVGLNLTAADYVFILDPWWNPAVEAQAVDRAHRIGQTNTVFTYKFITQNTVEEKILALQEKKKALIRDLVSTEDSFVKSLSAEDIEIILG